MPLFTLDWVRTTVGYLPTTAGRVLGSGALEPYGVGSAVLVLQAWAGVLLDAGMWAFMCPGA